MTIVNMPNKYPNTIHVYWIINMKEETKAKWQNWAKSALAFERPLVWPWRSNASQGRSNGQRPCFLVGLGVRTPLRGVRTSSPEMPNFELFFKNPIFPFFKLPNPFPSLPYTSHNIRYTTIKQHTPLININNTHTITIQEIHTFLFFSLLPSSFLLFLNSPTIQACI